MTPEQQGLIEDIATRFIAAAPETDWNELQVDVSMLNSISGFAATAVSPGGAEVPFFIDDATDKKILHALARLREDMASATPGRGAWYIMSLHIPRDDKPYVDFDYFSKPTFGVHVGDGAYKQDLKAFPRSEDYLPEWLGGKPRPVAPEPAPATPSTEPKAETTPPVASDTTDTPQVAPPADITLDETGELQPDSKDATEPQDEALAAAETEMPAPVAATPETPVTEEVGAEDTTESAPETAAEPEPAPEAAASDEDDTPWYEDETSDEAAPADADAEGGTEGDNTADDTAQSEPK